MSKHFEKFTRRVFLNWIGILTLATFLTFIISWNLNIAIPESLCEYYQYIEPILIVIILLAISIYVSKVLKWPWLRHLFYFFRPFYKNCNSNLKRYLVVLTLIIFVPWFIFSLFYYFQLLDPDGPFRSYNFFDQLAYFIAYLGLLLTVRVYFEVKEGHTETLEDFIKTLTEILDSSEKDDDMIIYAPTLFLNEAHILTGLTNYKNTAYRNKLLKFTDLKLILLECKSLLDHIKKTFKKKIPNNKELNNAAFNDFINNLQQDTSELNQFHQDNISVEIPDNDGDKTNQYYRDFAVFIGSLADRINIGGGKYDFIEFDDGKNDENRVNEKHGLFAIANFTKGIYYIGSFDLYKNGSSFFRGTYFQNKYLPKGEFKDLMNSITE